LQWNRWLDKAEDLKKTASTRADDTPEVSSNRYRSRSCSADRASISSPKSDSEKHLPDLYSRERPGGSLPQKHSDYVDRLTAFKPNANHICKGLLIMISNNLGQIAYLNAQRYSCKRIFFAGSFLRHYNTMAMKTLSYAIQFWSRGEMEALFLRYVS
jgi:type II pantothenate kinase